MVNIELVEKELNQQKLHSIYLFYGEEQYLIESCIKKIKKIFGECKYWRIDIRYRNSKFWI